jgi:signal transduction histidine kinase
MRRPPAPRPLDITLSGGLCVWWIAELGGHLGRRDVASLILMVAPLGWRRVFPLGAMIAVGAGFVVGEIGPDPPEPLAGLVAVLVASYSAAAHCASWRVALWGGVAVLASAIGAGLLGGDLVFILILTGGAWGAGAAVRRLQGRSVELQERAAALGERALMAAADERERIARELHDIVSHSVSLMVVQAGAAEQVLVSDPEQARQSLRAIQAAGRSAVDDLRRMLGLLRGSAADESSRNPQPGLAALSELVASFSGSGAMVDIEREPLPALPPGVEIAAYRIVQEALTNAAKHAPGCPTRVRISYAGGNLDLEATTRRPAGANGRGDGTGHGLAGMRERVAVYGGDLRVGPDENEDWVVQASLPVPHP